MSNHSRQAHEARPALAGLRVIDLTQMLAGPYCTMLLADLGADVVKVEPPAGDLTRTKGPFTQPFVAGDLGGYFQSVNRNKRSVVCDLRTEAGKASLHRLVATADVLVENFRPGVMEAFDLSYETLASANPRLVYAAVRGFGDPRTGASPRAQWPAFDIVAQALGGLIGINGAPGTPTKVGAGVGDIFPAALCAVGILAALHERETSGRGQFVDVAMYDAMLSLCERIVHQHSFAGDVPQPEGNTHPLLCPFDVFACSDGFVAIAAPSDRHWARLAEILGVQRLAQELPTNEGRVADAGRVRTAIGQWAGQRTKAQIEAALGGEVPVGAVHDIKDIFADEHVRARQMLLTVPEPASGRAVRVAGTPIKFSRSPLAPLRRAPLLDEHRAELHVDHHQERHTTA